MLQTYSFHQEHTLSQKLASPGHSKETSLPVYILVDKRTASAAEIFMAALQDNR